MSIAPLIRLEELVEEAAQRLTSEQLHALAARVGARELREATEIRKSVPRDLPTDVAHDLDATVRHLVDLWGPDGAGCDLDIVAAWLLPQIVRAGATEADAIAALTAHTGWRPRTAAEREKAALRQTARDLLDAGFSPVQVKAAMRSISGALEAT